MKTALHELQQIKGKRQKQVFVPFVDQGIRVLVAWKREFGLGVIPRLSSERRWSAG